MKTRVIVTSFVLLPFLFTHCTESETEPGLQMNFNFQGSAEGWVPFFSDYPPGKEQFYELHFVHTTLPEPLDQNLKGIMISSNNHSDDVLSLICKKVTGLLPDQSYDLYFDVELASQAEKNGSGIGGGPDLAFGVGALAFEPQNRVENASSIHEIYRPNFVVGLQSAVSTDAMQMIGTIGVDETTAEFSMINRNNKNAPFRARTNANGELWLIVGTDSGFEGITTLYYKSITVTFSLG